ncbi:MAG: hypothetical protein M3Z24_05385 [Chloroflexota bacterium]|nr:hypothetical protein [Chloroflexota bacterium]
MINTQSEQQKQGEQIQSSSNTAEMNSMICNICSAAYVPAPSHQYLLDASPLVRESAFMSMCHFCFRCRHAACPECWDEINGLCGACVKEIGLSFRVDAPPLKGVFFPPVRQLQAPAKRTTSPLLVCVRSGSFQTEIQQPSSDIVKAIESETMTTAAKESVGETKDIQHSPSLPHKGVKGVSRYGKKRQTEVNVSPDETKQEESFPLSKEGELKKGKVQIFRVIERALTGAAFLMVCFILSLIILAEIFPKVNAFIAHLLYIDIRAEIEYLGHLILRMAHR